MDTDKAKATELIRVGLPREGMTLARLYQILEVAETTSHDTIRYYNGSVIIERPAS